MPRLRWLPAAQADLLAILEFIAIRSGSAEVGLRFTGELRQKCRALAASPGTMGRPRPELRPDIRSVAYKGYVIFFRYEVDAFEVVNIVHGHRDIEAMFGDGEPTR